VQGNWKESATQATLGLEIVLGIVLPGYVGSVLDSHFDTQPTFIAIGFVVGLAHGVRAVMRVAKEGDAIAKKDEDEMRRKRAEYYGEQQQRK
jgi:F0F1-type ATP synthase assembly protein I